MKGLLRDTDTTKLVLEFLIDTPNGRRGVSRLARTCKKLKEPCLDALWKELDSINPLLSVMPGSLFKRARRPGMGFIKTPGPGDWTRVADYGRRVQRLVFNENSGNVHPSIFNVLADTGPQTCLVPNLATLIWKAESYELLERSLMFLPANLQNLIVEVGSNVSQTQLEEFLTTVAERTHLSAFSLTSATKLPNSFPAIFGEKTHLHHVALVAPGVLSAPIGKWLATLENLQSLQMDVTGRGNEAVGAFFGNETPSPPVKTKKGRRPNGSAAPVASQYFKQLQQINLTGDAVSISAFLGRVGASLRSIELVLEDPQNQKDWETLARTITDQFRGSLRSLQIMASGSSKFNDMIKTTARGDTSTRRLPLKALNLPYLNRLDIDLPESTVLLDDDIQHLSETSRNLEVFRFCPLSRWPAQVGPPKLTLAGLAPLTANCRRLHTLALPFHALGTTREDVFGPETSSRSLYRLQVGHSWVGEPLKAALLLSHLAPYLESVRWFTERNRPGYVEAHAQAWHTISEMLPQLQSMLLRERRYSPISPQREPQVLDSPPKIEPKELTPPPPPSPPPSPPPEPIKVETAEVAILATPSTSDVSTQTTVETEQKGISAHPETGTQGVMASPIVKDQEIEAKISQSHQSVDAVPVQSVQSQGTMTESIVKADDEEGDESASPQVTKHQRTLPGMVFGTLGHTLSLIFSGCLRPILRRRTKKP